LWKFIWGDEATGSNRTMLDVTNIDLHYGAAQALRGISLHAEPGKVTCVLGRNGVGKTSLLRAIVGQHPVSKGSITFNKTDITKLSTVERARNGIAIVPQGREIFPLLTVEENLETGFAPLPREARSVPDDVFSLFPVLGDMLGRRGGDLSGGQQQQLAIGRALVMRPRLLLLDEPTEGIQPSIIKDIGRAISYLRGLKEMAIVWSWTAVRSSIPATGTLWTKLRSSARWRFDLPAPRIFRHGLRGRQTTCQWLLPSITRARFSPPTAPAGALRWRSPPWAGAPAAPACMRRARCACAFPMRRLRRWRQ
jgi:urea transport system ATP-binding protein